jgi:hypothetical protein
MFISTIHDFSRPNIFLAKRIIISVNATLALIR